MASKASIVHVSFVVAFLLTTTTSAVAGSNATATSLRRSTAALSSAAASSAHNVSHQYTCYLCHKSRSLMVRRCPIAQDDCHLSCLTLPTPVPPSPPRAVAIASGGAGDRNADDCYLMKLYPDGSWVVVDVVSCKASAAACYLVCGKGDEHGGDDGGPAGRTGVVTPGGTLPHALPQFERCGDHLTARDAAIAG
ncbi:hypothetical protein HU200_044377 [Digitaria exilis]|uniref:Uncharacterized protein n=1 Tax=Digitaria exilis TaxID=1010633 RepID=A0A835BBY4_9POAL|nr:hypothetical protein HU200_044377 [Digitaria exilis]CAB3496550.1 unnamed protein product [Digitaria exilis]